MKFGVGRGQVVYEYNNFRVEYDSRTQRFQEIVDIILGLWSTPGFTYHGKYYRVDDLWQDAARGRDAVHGAVRAARDASVLRCEIERSFYATALEKDPPGCMPRHPDGRHAHGVYEHVGRA